MGSPSSYRARPQQNLAELAEFVEFIGATKAKSYCEIGCKFGGLLWAVAQAMPKGSRLVAVDKPNGPWGRTDSETSLRQCVGELQRTGYDAHLFLGDSTAPDIVAKVGALAPFDVLFIDANHTEPFVRRDFASYGKLARCCCLHDIGWNNPTPPGRMAIEVPKVWREFKTTFADAATFREIRHDNGHNGIGIMQWMHAPG
jgi:hypothetical protein